MAPRFPAWTLSFRRSRRPFGEGRLRFRASRPGVRGCITGTYRLHKPVAVESQEAHSRPGRAARLGLFVVLDVAVDQVADVVRVTLFLFEEGLVGSLVVLDLDFVLGGGSRLLFGGLDF